MNEFIPKFVTNHVTLTFGGKNDQLWGLVKPKNFKKLCPAQYGKNKHYPTVCF